MIGMFFKNRPLNTYKLVGRKLSLSNRMLVAEAYNRGVQFEKLPKGKFRMYDANNSYTIVDGKISTVNNSRQAIRLTDLKDQTSQHLRSRGFFAPDNALFEAGDLASAWSWAKVSLPVVVKPRDDTHGRHVYINLTDVENFAFCFNQVAAHTNEVLVERFVEGKEYRMTYVDQAIVAVAKRRPSHVIGDGEQTIAQLIAEKNKERIARQNPVHKQIPLDVESRRVLAEAFFTFDSIPALDEWVYLRHNSNISTGGDAIDMTNKIDKSIKASVSQAVQSIIGLHVAGIDVIISGKNYFILEINAHPMLSMHHYPWIGARQNIIQKVIDYMFPQTKQR